MQINDVTLVAEVIVRNNSLAIEWDPNLSDQERLKLLYDLCQYLIQGAGHSWLQ